MCVQNITRKLYSGNHTECKKKVGRKMGIHGAELKLPKRKPAGYRIPDHRAYNFGSKYSTTSTFFYDVLYGPWRHRTIYIVYIDIFLRKTC